MLKGSSSTSHDPSLLAIHCGGNTQGDRLEFEARIKEYRKGYIHRNYKIDHSSTDFKLSPTKIRKVINSIKQNPDHFSPGFFSPSLACLVLPIV